MNMKFRNLKYAMYGLASLLFVNCTEEDNKVKVPEYTKFENPEWIVAAGPVPATAPTDWTVEFTGGVNMPEWQKLAATPAERPTWTVPDMHIYPASMTAIIRMSDYIQPSISSADLLGAFVGEECRGISFGRSMARCPCRFAFLLIGIHSRYILSTTCRFCRRNDRTGDAHR